MAKYQTFRKPDEPKKNDMLHPIWRGVGFVMMGLVPILSVAGGLYLFQENRKYRWFSIPNGLIIPELTFDPYILVKVILVLLLLIAISIVLYTLSIILIRLFAPPRYGPFDVPPVVYKKPKRK